MANLWTLGSYDKALGLSLWTEQQDCPSKTLHPICLGISQNCILALTEMCDLCMQVVLQSLLDPRDGELIVPRFDLAE